MLFRSPLNVLTIMVQDSNDNRLDSFLVSAVARNKLVVGYWLAPFLVGIVMNLLCLFLSEGFIVMNGGEWLSMRSNLEMAGLIIANTFSATSILFVAAMLTKSVSLYSTFTGIMSALVGFITSEHCGQSSSSIWIRNENRRGRYRNVNCTIRRASHGIFVVVTLLQHPAETHRMAFLL